MRFVSTVRGPGGIVETVRACGRLVVMVTVTAMSCAGCSRGPATAEVTGKVVFNGKPVEGGSISLAQGSEAPTTVPVSADGSFTMRPVVGKNDISYLAPQAEVVPGKTAETAPPPSRFEGLQPKEMAIEVAAGRQEIQVELIKPGKPGK